MLKNDTSRMCEGFGVVALSGQPGRDVSPSQMGTDVPPSSQMGGFIDRPTTNAGAGQPGVVVPVRQMRQMG